MSLTIATLVLLSAPFAAAPKGTDIDCAQCRAVCKSGSVYPDGERPDMPAAEVRHKTTDAKRAFEEAKQNDPGFGGGDVMRAVDNYRRAVLLDPDNSQYRNHLAAALLASGNNDEAIHNLETAIRLVPGESKYLVNLGYAWHRRGDEQRALLHYMRALILDPKNTRARLFAGYALEYFGLNTEAATEFRRVLRQDPDNGGANAGLRRLGVTLEEPAPRAP